MTKFDQNYYKKTRSELTAEIDDHRKALASDGDQYSDLIKGHQEYLAFVEMEKRWYTEPLVLIPYDLLVMFLVILMGALGGVVRIVRSYLDTGLPSPASRDYFFVPTIGMVVAIGGYVLAKTGLLVLSSAKEEASLSPFMIGLVGIISGLLAKEVIDRITSVGIPMLQGKSRAEPQAMEAAPGPKPGPGPQAEAASAD
jgi:hypothetical protein